MWASITNIEQPDSLEQAYSLYSAGEKEFLAGGSYLVAQSSAQIHTLININSLLGMEIQESQDSITFDAAVTLQMLVDHLPQDSLLAQAAKYSCFSRNLRNQRTLGGEIATQRANSELYTVLYALNPTLEVVAEQKSSVSLRDWSKQGIITKITISLPKIQQLKLQRYAAIPSAPAFAVVASVASQDSVEFAVGGKCSGVSAWGSEKATINDEVLQKAASDTVDAHFSSDHYGSVAYKKTLLQVALRRCSGVSD